MCCVSLGTGFPCTKLSAESLGYLGAARGVSRSECVSNRWEAERAREIQVLVNSDLSIEPAGHSLLAAPHKALL